MARLQKENLVDELLAELQRLDLLAAAQNNYQKTLALLRALKAGTIELDRVQLTPDGWQVAAVIQPAIDAATAATEATEPSAEATATP